MKAHPIADVISSLTVTSRRAKIQISLRSARPGSASSSGERLLTVRIRASKTGQRQRTCLGTRLRSKTFEPLPHAMSLERRRRLERGEVLFEADSSYFRQPRN
jgi:hypothetical protein